MHAITAPPEITPADRLGVTVFFAVAAHLIVILGVTFVPHDRPRNLVNTLDVVLVQQKTEAAPEEPDYLAQASHEGGGESEEKDRPATPLPAPFESAEPAIAAASVAPSEPVPAVAEPAQAPTPPPPPPPREIDAAAAKPVLAQRETPTELKAAEPEPVEKPTPKAAPKPEKRAAPDAPRKRFAQSEPERKVETEAEAPAKPAPSAPPQPTRTVDATTLVNRSLAMAALRAEIDVKLHAYAQRPRQKWISARTREHKYAAYMEAWRRKVERIGNLNYPDEARRHQMSGKLLLDVALNRNGSVHEIILRRSSGKKVLDDAAMRIVKLAAPYARFPEEIAEEVDILHIERTWLFLSNNRFSSD